MLGESHSGHCAEVDGRVVGFSRTDRTAGSVFALFVRPEHEGEGLGTQLLAAAVADLWSAGHVRSTLSTEPRTRAFDFYVRHGWRHVGYTPAGEAELELIRPS
jgi:GNAT superfamily N-acetyltransferase